MGFYCATRCFPSNAQISKERKTFRAKPLPTIRPRALTLPLEDDNGQDQSDRTQNLLSRIIKNTRARPQRTHDQKESLLITRLPYEIRLQIWRYLLCDHHLHLVRAPKRLLGIRCDEDESIADCNHDCWGVSTISEYCGRGAAGYYKEKKDGARCENANLLSVLKTCRLIYSETIELIYSGNTFDFNSADTILSLSQTILHSRLSLLRVVRLEHSFPRFLYTLSNPDTVSSPKDIPSSDPDQFLESPYTVAPFDAKTWKQACSILASLTRLQKLYMHLGGDPLNEPWQGRDNIKPILGSLMQIRQPGLLVFEVSVPWNENPETEYNIKGAPFRLVNRHSRCVCPRTRYSKESVSGI